MEFLGIIIGQGKIEMDEKKLKAIEKWKPPTSVKGVQSLTGFTNFYNVTTELGMPRHIPDNTRLKS